MRFALGIVRFCRTLPDTWEGRHVRDQLFGAGTGVAANYHATCRARSHRDFVSKLGVVGTLKKSAICNQQFAFPVFQRNPSIISSSASRPGRTRSSGSVASGSSTTFSWVRKSSRSGSM